MAIVDVTIYFLEMLAHAKRSVPAPRGGLSVIHAKHPTVTYYRFLYNGVGKDYHWYSRGRLADFDLAAVIQNPLNGLQNSTGATTTTSSWSSSA